MNISSSELILALIGFLSSVFWYWLTARDKRIKDVENEIKQVKQDYRRRDDAEKEFELIIGLFNEIKEQIARISEKLDQKADK